MRDLGWRVQGVDFDPDAAALARGKGLNVVVGTIESQGYTADSFDAVTLNHVIEHVPNPLGLLRECHRILKPGGRLFLATPNSRSLGHRIFKQSWRGLEPPRHLQVFTPSALRRLLLEVGFVGVCVQTHASKYVAHHSTRLAWSLGGNAKSASALALALLPQLFTLFEQGLLMFAPGLGECVCATSVKE